jgi:hypothetical protein
VLLCLKGERKVRLGNVSVYAVNLFSPLVTGTEGRGDWLIMVKYMKNKAPGFAEITKMK